MALGALGGTAAAEERIRASDAGGIEAAIEQAESGDTVVVDGTFEETEISMRSGVDVVGQDNGPAAVSGARGDVLRVENVSNVRIEGLTVDGEGEAARCIGSGKPNQISDVAVENCDVADAKNGIHLRGIDDDQRFRDVTIANNEVRNTENFGIFVGIDKRGDYGTSSGIVRRAEIRNNRVEDVAEWKGITLSGRPDCPVENSVIAENVVENVGLEEPGAIGGNGIVLEDVVRDSRVEGNEVRNTDESIYTCNGGARNNEFRDNIGENGTSGISCSGGMPHSGDPEGNRFIGNELENLDIFGVYNAESHGNTYQENVFVDFDDRMSDESLGDFEDNTWRA
jgi:nitrous oxidase accessory protein